MFVGAVLATAVLAGCGADEPPATAELSTVTGERPRLGSGHGVVNATYTFVIPPEAGASMAAGEIIDILPRSLTARVGESIRIVNEDRQGHTVGPWYVGPHETLTQKFASPGVYEGLCTVHSSGEFLLQVSEA